MRESLEDNNHSHAVFAISAFALQIVQQRFGIGGGPMAFHQFNHSLGVMQRARKLIVAFSAGKTGYVSYIDLCLAMIAATCHDVEQRFTTVNMHKTPDDKEFGRTFRQRHSGENELLSAEFAVRQMRIANESLPDVNFTDEHYKIVTGAIMGTVAVFDPSVMTVVQKALTPDCHPVARSVMLADIGTAVMGPAGNYVKEGEQLFVEDNTDMKAGLDFTKMSRRQELYYRDRMMTWLEGQAKFPMGRWNLLERELEGLPGPAKDETRKLFSSCKDSMELQQARNNECSQMSTPQLYRAFGF